MSKGRRLRDMLERVSGEEEVEFTIPYLFLPPRYRAQSEKRNMVLILDRNMTLHVKWEGSRISEWNSITPGECRRIVASVLSHLGNFRDEIRAFSRFMDENAEMPLMDPRFEPLSESEEKAREKAAPEERVSPPQTEGAIALPVGMSVTAGGESPFPSLSWEW